MDDNHPLFTPEELAELRRRLEVFRKNPRDGVTWEVIEAAARERRRIRAADPMSPPTDDA